MVNFDLNRTLAALEIEPLMAYRKYVKRLRTVMATDEEIFMGWRSSYFCTGLLLLVALKFEQDYVLEKEVFNIDELVRLFKVHRKSRSGIFNLFFLEFSCFQHIAFFSAFLRERTCPPWGRICFLFSYTCTKFQQRPYPQKMPSTLFAPN